MQIDSFDDLFVDGLERIPTDSFITSDEWDYMRGWIFDELRACEVKGGVDPEHLPFFALFKGTIKDKLIEAGFRKEIIEDGEELERLIYIINIEQGGTFKNHRWDLQPPYGFPSGTYRVSENGKTFWIKKDIEAALLTLDCLTTLKKLLVNNDITLDKPVVNIEAVRVYLCSLEMVINLVRAGNISRLARAEAEKREKSEETRRLKKLVLRCIINNIFNKNPQRPKTLGEVWNKIDGGNEIIRLNENRKIYWPKTGKVKGKDVVIIEGFIELREKDANGKDIIKDGREPFIYAKRSLQYHINEVKNNPIKVTQ